jgi:multiple sugar transport system substrate-binding protein
MRKRRRVFLLIMAVILIASPVVLMAGGQQEAEGVSLADHPIVKDGWLRSWKGIEIVLSTHQGPTTDAMIAKSKEFEQITGAKVTVLAESWTDLLSKHMASFAAEDKAYDVITYAYLWAGHYIEGRVIENLDDWFSRDDLADPNYGMDDMIPAVLDAYGRYTGAASPDAEALWAVPYKFDIYTAQYRQDIFDGAGVAPPETWEDLLAAAKVIKKKYPDIIPVVFPLAGDDCVVSTYLPIITAMGGAQPMPWFDGNLFPKFQEAPGKKAIQYLLDLLPYMPVDVLNYDYDKVNQLMAQGKVAYALNWNAYLPVLVDPSKSSIVDTVKFANTPGGVGGRPQGLGGWSMAISSQSENKEAAFQLLQFLSNETNAVDLALKGAAVARNSVGMNSEIISKYPFYPLLMKGAKDAVARGSDRSWSEIQRIIGVGLAGILAGDDIDTAMLDTARKVYNAAEQAGYTPNKTGPRP